MEQDQPALFGDYELLDELGRGWSGRRLLRSLGIREHEHEHEHEGTTWGDISEL